MKRKPTILLLVGLFVCGMVAWYSYAPSPTIRFMEYRDGEFKIPGEPWTADRAAIFRITNDSSAPYSYFGYGPSLPFYVYRYSDPSDESGWLALSPRKYGEVADTIAPHSTLDIAVPALSEEQFAIGIHFERGTAGQLEWRSALSRFLRRQGFFRTSENGPEPTWSNAAQADARPAP